MLHATTLRLLFFSGILISLIILENIFPKRALDQKRSIRWFNNLTLIVIGSTLVQFVIPLVPFAFTLYAKAHHFGVFNHLSLPCMVTLLLTIVIMDFLIYCQHVCFHKITFLWRLHLVHHTDLNLDVTSAERFHPIEILLSTGYKLLAIFVFGFPPLDYLIFEILFNFFTQFTHSNLRIPLLLDKCFRIAFITPDIHRTHHSVRVEETNSNFGTIFIFWDKLFRLYLKAPMQGQQKMTIGLTHFRAPSRLKLWHLLVIPFLKNITGGYANWF